MPLFPMFFHHFYLFPVSHISINFTLLGLSLTHWFPKYEGRRIIKFTITLFNLMAAN